MNEVQRGLYDDSSDLEEMTSTKCSNSKGTDKVKSKGKSRSTISIDDCNSNDSGDGEALQDKTTSVKDLLYNAMVSKMLYPLYISDLTILIFKPF